MMLAKRSCLLLQETIKIFILPNSHKLKVYSKNAFYELLTNLVLHLLAEELLIICS